jgi:hypothetical protein
VLPFGVTIPATVPQRSEIPEALKFPYIYCFIFSLKMAFKAETCCCKVFKLVVN